MPALSALAANVTPRKDGELQKGCQMDDCKTQQLEIKRAVFNAVLDGVRTGHMECPARVFSDLCQTATDLLLDQEEVHGNK